MQLPSALAVDEGQCVAVVGAGGKKTTLYRLGGLLDRAVVTATVRIPIFDDQVTEVMVTDDPLPALAERETDDESAWPLGLVPERDRDDRYKGFDIRIADRIAAEHDGPVLVKADGARNRLLKAPDDREPRIPTRADTVLAIASVRAVGKPLTDEWVHRPELVADRTALDLGDEISPEAVGRLLASPQGGLKDVPDGATAIAMVNMVDGDDQRAVAEQVASEALARSDRLDRVVLTRMVHPDPVVEIFR